MAWVETESPNFTARHEERDADDVVELLGLLEGTRARMAEVFPSVPDHVGVVIHGSNAALALAQPYIPIVRQLTAPAARRYLVGWFGRDTVHVLAPRILRERASNVPGSEEMALRAPAAYYAQLVVGHNNPQLPPPFRLGRFIRYLRWAWLPNGAAQWFSGQTAFARPAIARRLREGPEPSFPPSLRDSILLGGTVFDLIAREEGEEEAVKVACRLPPGGPKRALVYAFKGRPLVHTDGTWRAHLSRIAGQA
jgi:hypothetical protein